MAPSTTKTSSSPTCRWSGSFASGSMRVMTARRLVSGCSQILFIRTPGCRSCHARSATEMISDNGVFVVLMALPPSSRYPRNPVVARAVVPEDLALALVGDRELHERLDRLRILGIEVGPVGREDDGVVAHVIDDLFHEVLVGLHGHEALALEVLAGLHGEQRVRTPERHLVVLVQTPEEEGHPAAVSLQEGDAQIRMAFQDAASDHADHGQHHLHGMAGRMDHLEVRAEAVAHLWQVRAEPFMEAERHPEAEE